MESTTNKEYKGTREGESISKEASLVLAAQRGDVQAFNTLVLAYQDKIFNLASRILGDTDQAEDITQNTFLTAYLNLPRFRNGSFGSWLYRIATNACYDEYRRHKRYTIMSIDHDELDEERIAPLDDFSSTSLLPEKEAERHETAMAVQHALDTLDVDHRAVVVLVDVQDVDYQEAANILGIPIGTVKSRLSRARQHLREYFGSSSSRLVGENEAPG